MNTEFKKNRRFAIRFSGVGPSLYKDGKIKEINYAYLFSDIKNGDLVDYFNEQYETREDGVDWVPYKNIYSASSFLIDGESHNWIDFNPVILNYSKFSQLGISKKEGLYSISGISASHYSIYRREYEVFGTNPQRNQNGTLSYDYQEVKGDWQPVIIDSPLSSFRDFNVQADKTYQYILYPSDYLNDGAVDEGNGVQIFANYDQTIFDKEEEKFITGDITSAWCAGMPISTGWKDWTIIELIPEENKKNVPIVKKTYKANLEQMWMFKYGLETGSQTQNISRNEIQTLGQYPKIGYGKTDYISGDVTAMLGSEILPYHGQGYVERLWQNRGKEVTIPTTNEKTLMLNQWRELVASKNPKLLRDMKGQAWIVQIMSSSNTPKNFVKDQPDTISFQWKQIENVENVIIYGDFTDIPSSSSFSTVKSYVKTPMFKNGWQSTKRDK